MTRTLAEAERQGRIMRGEGDAEAAKLFADAFSKDPDFYAFIRSLRAYQNSFSGNQDVMVMSPDSDFFRYMKTRLPQRVDLTTAVQVNKATASSGMSVVSFSIRIMNEFDDLADTALVLVLENLADAFTRRHGRR